MFETAEHKGLGGLLQGTAGSAGKLLIIQTLPCQPCHLNKSFEYNVAKIPLGVPSFLEISLNGHRIVWVSGWFDFSCSKDAFRRRTRLILMILEFLSVRATFAGGQL
jgi:hypothetical protein